MWPDHTKAGGLFSARQLLEDIIFTCQSRLDSGLLPPLYVNLYELILSHARLCIARHDHGDHSTFLQPDGSGQPPNPPLALDNAWDHVHDAHVEVTKPSPSLPELQQALDGIDHGAGGSGIV